MNLNVLATVQAPDSWAYYWNAPKSAIAGQYVRPLTRDEFRQGQVVLDKVKTLSSDLYQAFTSRHQYLLKEKGLHAANKYLVFTLGRTILPRVDSVNAAHSMDLNASMLFMSEADTYHRLAKVHQYGLRDRPSVRAKEMQYPARPLLGLDAEDIKIVEDELLILISSGLT